jgi:hypothetical protein
VSEARERDIFRCTGEIQDSAQHAAAGFAFLGPDLPEKRFTGSVDVQSCVVEGFGWQHSDEAGTCSREGGLDVWVIRCQHVRAFEL